MSSLSERLTDLVSMVRKSPASVPARTVADFLIELEAVYGYELAMLDRHLVAAPTTQCGYVLCGVKADERFNKWGKVIGGYGPESGPYGDYLVYENREDAQKALTHMEPIISKDIRIFPVVLVASRIPKISGT